MIRRSREERLGLGFTLIELMIVVSIIGVLAAIALPKFSDMVRKANEGATLGGLGSLRGALNIYYSDMEGFYPASTVPNLSFLTLGGQYMASLPTSYVLPYHQQTTISRSCGGGLPVDPNLETVVMGCAGVVESAHQGGAWVYNSFVDASGATISVYISVACRHTDSKGIIWTSY